MIPPCSSHTSGEVQIQAAEDEQSASDTQTLIVIPRKNYQNNRYFKQRRDIKDDIKDNLTVRQRTHQAPGERDKRYPL